MESLEPEAPARRGRPWPSGVGWLTALLVAAVVAINVAGIASIATARRGALEEAAQDLRLETRSRAGTLETVLASTRADLLFLTGSPTLFGLETALLSRDPREARWRRLEAEGALLLYLRGHSEVAHLAARSADGVALVEAGRRGGVPVLWLTGPGVRPDAAPADGVPAGRSVKGVFAFTTGVRRVSGAVTLEATIDAAKLLERSAGIEGGGRLCRLDDAAGRTLAADQARHPGAGPAGAPGDGEPRAEATLDAEGWSAPSPWRLVCGRRPEATSPLLEPIVARSRTILMLNLSVMSLAILLGAVAMQEMWRRARLEAGARHEARVRELERQLFHAERLGTVGRLAAGMAHEINNPLEGMVNYLGLARADLDRGDAASARRRLDGIEEGVQRAVAIVRQVLLYGDPARAPLSPVDLNAAVARAVEFVGTRREFAAIRFELDLRPGPLMVRANPTLLDQVYLNLLLNACEAQPAGGEVRIATREEGRSAVVTIADRGPGVPSGERARVFEPFYSTKHSAGLGLSICDAIVARHRGELRVRNREGGGAEFRIDLPLGEGDGA